MAWQHAAIPLCTILDPIIMSFKNHNYATCAALHQQIIALRQEVVEVRIQNKMISDEYLRMRHEVAKLRESIRV